MSRVPKGFYNENWDRKAKWVITYLTSKKGRFKYYPAVLRKWGEDNFEVRDGKLFAYGREIVTDKKQKQRIVEELEEGVGGVQAAYSRVQRQYIGIALRMIKAHFTTSERRQVKRLKRNAGTKTFIATSRVGSIQADCMFFPTGTKKNITVFGMVDIFSRWIYYRVIKNKTPWETAAAFKEGVDALEKLSGASVWQLRTDDGTEWKHDPRNQQLPEDEQQLDFATYCKQKHIHLTAKKQPARNIESSNRRLRLYVERVQYADLAELRRLIARFIKEKNQTKHLATGLAPIDAIVLDAENTKKLAKKQLARGRARVSKTKVVGRRDLRIGDLVRIQLESEKTKLGHQGVKPVWSKKIYKVVRTTKSTRGAKRYKLEDASGKKVDGLYFAWRLMYVVKPTHNIDAKTKLDVSRREQGDIEREEEAARPDLIEEPGWVKPNYKNAQGPDFSSGSEYDPEDEKQQHPKKKQPKAKPKKAVKKDPPPKPKKAKKDPPPKPKKAKKVPPKKAEKKDPPPKPDPPVLRRSSRRRGKKVKPIEMIGRKMQIWWDDEVLNAPVVVLEKYKGHYIVRFRNGDITGIDAKPGPGSQIHNVWPERMTAKTIEKYILAGRDAILRTKDEIDQK